MYCIIFSSTMCQGEAGGTEVLATAASEVSITKHICTDEANAMAGDGVHKVIVISTTDWLVTGRTIDNVMWSSFVYT